MIMYDQRVFHLVVFIRLGCTWLCWQLCFGIGLVLFIFMFRFVSRYSCGDLRQHNFAFSFVCSQHFLMSVFFAICIFRIVLFWSVYFLFSAYFAIGMFCYRVFCGLFFLLSVFLLSVFFACGIFCIWYLLQIMLFPEKGKEEEEEEKEVNSDL